MGGEEDWMMERIKAWIASFLQKRLDKKKRDVIKLKWQVEAEKKKLEELKKRQG